jgi:hypothetical protein
MSIRDIIEALREFAYDNRPRHWKVLKCSVAIQQLDELAKEVALMEAVCEAVGRCGSGLVMDAPHEWRTVAEAYDALQAYRKERGL